MQAGFAVCIAQGLVRKHGVLRQPREAVCLVPDLSETAIVPAPADAAFHICHFQRRAVQVSTEPVDFPGPVFLQMVDPRQRAPGLVPRADTRRISASYVLCCSYSPRRLRLRLLHASYFINRSCQCCRRYNEKKGQLWPLKQAEETDEWPL